MTEQTKGVAVVTGGSAGIGAVYANRLARRGYDLILVGRNKDRLSAVADEIKSATGRNVETVAADLADRADTKRVEDILRDDSRITLLVNNAGLGAVAPVVASDIDAMSDLITVNNIALVRLTQAVLPKFLERNSGAIINLSSGVAIGVEILNGVYSASKAFVLAFSQSLRHEIGDKNVRIQVVLPGATATDIWANAGMPVENLPPEMVMTPEKVVDAALVGFDQGEFATAPSLEDIALWESHEQSRQTLGQNLSRNIPAARYGLNV